MQETFNQATASTSSIMKETIFDITHALKIFHRFRFLKTKDVTNESLYFLEKIKYIL